MPRKDAPTTYRQEGVTENADYSRPLPEIEESPRLSDLLLTDAEAEDEAAYDPSYPEEHRPRRLSSGRAIDYTHKLTIIQQRNIAAWIVDGFTFAQAVQASKEQDWSHPLTKPMWTYYRTRRIDLLQEATQFLEQQYLSSGFGLTSLRIRALVDHARRLEAYVKDGRMMEADVHAVGFGRDMKLVTTQKFNATVSKEYRETIVAIDKLAAPIEARLAANRERGRAHVAPDDAARFQEAARFRAEPFALAVEGEDQPYALGEPS